MLKSRVIYIENDNVNLDKGAQETASNKVGLPTSILNRYPHQNADYMLSERWYDGFLSAGVMTSMKSGKKK